MENKKLISLLEENKKLKEEIEKLQKDQIDFAAHKIFKEAQNKFIRWISVIIIAISIFGIVSINNIIQSINRRIEEKGIEKIVDDIKDEFINKHQLTVINETTRHLIPLIVAKAEVTISELLIKKIKDAEKKVSKNITLGDALEILSREEEYYVIVASSLKRRLLENYKREIINKIGEDFNKEFPELKIYPPKEGNKNYALILNINLPLEEAKKLLNKSIEYGFQDDSYISRVKK